MHQIISWLWVAADHLTQPEPRRRGQRRCIWGQQVKWAPQRPDWVVVRHIPGHARHASSKAERDLLWAEWHRNSPDQEDSSIHHREQHVEADGAILVPVEGRVDPPLPASKVDPDEKQVNRPIPDANLEAYFR